jgi:hypothetical protein
MKIDFGENFGSSQLIKKNIDLGERIFVFDGYSIEGSVVNTQHFFLTKSAGQPKEKKLGECSPYRTIPGVGFSVQLVLWEAYDKVI